MSATVRDLMTEKLVTVSRRVPMDEVHDLMLEHGIRHVPVVDEDSELVGLVSHRDIAALLGSHAKGLVLAQAELLSGKRAEQAMTRAVETIEPDESLQVAAEIMLENKFGCLPVCEGARLVGILTEADFVRYVAISGN